MFLAHRQREMKNPAGKEHGHGYIPGLVSGLLWGSTLNSLKAANKL